MDKETIQIMKSQFDLLSHQLPEGNIEFWFARDLMNPLGYARWENFKSAVKRAIDSFETTGYKVDDHFRGVTKMIEIGSSGHAPRGFHDYLLHQIRNRERPQSVESTQRSNQRYLKFLNTNIEQGMSNGEVLLRHSLFFVRYSAVQKNTFKYNFLQM